ncbi:NmrA-like family domain-containing oxidoreductase ptmS [Trichinella spiralis]|uniref:NmrA-like family domain-containing oxidoreductase ptmS n=1 Tax=Trichinella spiralis TaxID=6334 RepID=A0ABR3K8I4_TRISP
MFNYTNKKQLLAVLGEIYTPHKIFQSKWARALNQYLIYSGTPQLSPPVEPPDELKEEMKKMAGDIKHGILIDPKNPDYVTFKVPSEIFDYEENKFEERLEKMNKKKAKDKQQIEIKDEKKSEDEKEDKKQDQKITDESGPK